MAAVKPFFYKLHDNVKGLCVSIDIDSYVHRLQIQFNEKAKDTPLPDGPLFYTDAPRQSNEVKAGRYGFRDAVTDCLRLHDRDGKAKKDLADRIAARVVKSASFRERLQAENLVPQSMNDLLSPLDPDENPVKKEVKQALISLYDRDYSTSERRRGGHHPLARIAYNLPESEKLLYMRDYVIGKKRPEIVPRATRIGTHKNFTEYNLTRWLEQNQAYRLDTVGDVMSLKALFTATNRLKSNVSVSVSRVEPGEIKTVHALQLGS